MRNSSLFTLAFLLMSCSNPPDMDAYYSSCHKYVSSLGEPDAMCSCQYYNSSKGAYCVIKLENYLMEVKCKLDGVCYTRKMAGSGKGDSK